VRAEERLRVTAETLEDKLRNFDCPVDMLRNAPTGPYVFPIAPEFSNWRDEQRAWMESAALLDQSFHMTDVYLEGPDTVRLLSDVAVNSFATFGRNKAKQLVACNEDGHVIGDAVLFGLEDDKVCIVGRPALGNWVQYHAEAGGYRVEVTRDERALDGDGRRLTFRFQVQGPNAATILEEASGAPLPDIPFFSLGEIVIDGVAVRALNHGMARMPGLELVGPAGDRDRVLAALLTAGAEHSLRRAGARAYSSVAVESGWIPSPTPAVYSSEGTRPYREWLPADGWEANISLGGSFVSPSIEDYYQTPWDLGYGRLVKFDHEFIGREALERQVDAPHRRKVWMRWDRDAVLGVFASMLGSGEPAKYMDMPAAHYATLPFDSILLDSELVGLSTYPAYTANVRDWCSLAMVDEAHAEDGAELTIVWGEPDGGTAKPVVERHAQVEIPAVLSTTSPVHRAGGSPSTKIAC
jgi:vanillate/3-O-methylgallate O-demethylase